MKRQLEDGVFVKIYENEVQEGQLKIVVWDKQIDMTKKGAKELWKVLNEYFGEGVEKKATMPESMIGTPIYMKIKPKECLILEKGEKGASVIRNDDGEPILELIEIEDEGGG